MNILNYIVSCDVWGMEVLTLCSELLCRSWFCYIKINDFLDPLVCFPSHVVLVSISQCSANLQTICPSFVDLLCFIQEVKKG